MYDCEMVGVWDSSHADYENQTTQVAWVWYYNIYCNAVIMHQGIWFCNILAATSNTELPILVSQEMWQSE